MVWALIASLALFSNGSPNVAPPKPRARLVRVSTPPQYGIDESSNYASILQVLQLVNQARAQVGVAPLQLDQGLNNAAQAHADEMAARGQLTHELPGEPPVVQRVVAQSDVRLDREAENVAYAGSVEDLQGALMNSPPHRANVLNASYNVAGIGLARDGETLYLVQDFGHSVPAYSTVSAQEGIVSNLNRDRAQSGLPALEGMNDRAAQQSACAMARADSLNISSPQARYVLRYTSVAPDKIPGDAARAVSDPEVRGVSAGACYARTASYPSGVYWVTVLFY